MKINIVSMGKIKEDSFNNLIKEYIKRISPYSTIIRKELEDEKIISSQKIDLIKEKEGDKIIKALSPNSYKIALTEQGKNLSSEELAIFVKESLINSGKTEISFIIGGALGLSEKVLDSADYKLSLSKMTFTHQMVYVFLLEQIYRSFKIINGEPYHK